MHPNREPTRDPLCAWKQLWGRAYPSSLCSHVGPGREGRAEILITLWQILDQIWQDCNGAFPCTMLGQHKICRSAQLGTQHAICMGGDDATRMVRLVGHAMRLQLPAVCCSRLASPRKLSKSARQISPTLNGQRHWEPPSMPMPSPERGNDMAARADDAHSAHDRQTATSPSLGLGTRSLQSPGLWLLFWSLDFRATT